MTTIAAIFYFVMALLSDRAVTFFSLLYIPYANLIHNLGTTYHLLETRPGIDTCRKKIPLRIKVPKNFHKKLFIIKNKTLLEQTKFAECTTYQTNTRTNRGPGLKANPHEK